MVGGRRRHRWWMWGLMLVLFLAVVEGFAYWGTGRLAQRHAMYEPPPIPDFDRQYAVRHPLLGWPGTRVYGDEMLDEGGSRAVPAFPDTAQPSCVALFGDSFTWGAEVSAEQAYGNVLAQSLGCRVANYGVGGYGTDQAYLRYSQVIDDPAPVVVLGHYTRNILRNLTRNFGFIGNLPNVMLKPRFRLKQGKLELVPLPHLTQEEYDDLGWRGAELLPHDYFVPGGPSGVVARRFPYSWSLLQGLGHYGVRAALAHEPTSLDFYRPEHEAGGLQLTTKIVEAFLAEARRRKQRALLLLIPGSEDLRWFLKHGAAPYESLRQRVVAGLAADAAPPKSAPAAVVDAAVVDAAPALAQALGQRDPCALYAKCIGGHFSPEGYRELAAAVHAAIVEQGWLEAVQSAGH